MSMMDDQLIRYEFGSTNGGDETGFNDPVSTAYKGNISYYLARESLQNVIDARDPKSDKPAVAVFSLVKVPISVIPDLNNLEKVFKTCSEYYPNNTDCTEFFNRALKKIRERSDLFVLKVSDYNTTGLTGEDTDREGNYYAFMKAVGSSSKFGGSGGSFGLGKGAFFNASAFKTIFVSSCFNGSCMFQGKLRLVSHKMDGDIKQGNGSYGNQQQLPIRKNELIPEFFKREEQGTDIYVIDYLNSEDWKDQMIRSVLENFWLSILDNKLEVIIGDIKVNLENLDEKLHEYFSDDDRDSVEKANPLPFYHAYINATPVEKSLEVIGESKLWLFQKAGYPKRISMIRKTGMIIERRKYDFIGGFAGVFVCSDKNGNEILRRMENEQHTTWKKENAKGSKYEDQAKIAAREINIFIKEELEKLRPSNVTDSLTIPGLENYLYLQGDDTNSAINSGTLNEAVDLSSSREGASEIGKTQELQPPARVFKSIPAMTDTVTAGKKGGTFPILENEGHGGHGNGGGGSDGEGKKRILITKDIKFRSFAANINNGKYEHHLMVSGPPKKDCEFEVEAGTDDSFVKLDVTEASDSKGIKYPCEGNIIKKLMFDDEGKIKLKLGFGDNDRYSLRLLVYENK